MRWWSFKRGTLVLMILAAPMLAEAAGRDTVTVRTDTLPAKEQTPFMYRYDRRLERYQRRFNSLIPQTQVLQFYGDMGLVSVGIGWDYGKREQWETNFLIGVVPKYNSDKTRLSFTLKQNYTPWSFSLNEVVSLEPFSTGLYLNTIFGDKFWTHEPDRYPQGYYGFSTRVRIHIFAGQSVTFAIPREKRFFAKAVSAFYELSSCDLYIVSAFTNGYLKPKDYLRLSFGLRFKIL